ncbi:hypothetical protein ES703_98761 [subsurface metagenome]
MNETTQNNNITCKYCGGNAVVKFGKYKGVQRYWCKVCNRKFKADDTTFHMKTPVRQVTSALSMFYEGMSIKAIRRNLQQEYGNMPSTATIYEWIQKYTQYATDSIKDYQPKSVGDTWIADETVLEIDGQNMWLFDIIDDKTRYLLATRLTRSRTTRDAQMLIDKAIKTAGKSPKVVITDKLKSYIDVRYGGGEHRQGRPFALKDSTQKIERWHSTLKTRTKVMRGLKNFETATDFVNGWLVHYNYLRPHTALDDKTPAEVAGVEYPYRNWADIIRKHKPSRPIIIEHQPRDRAKLPPIQVGRPRKRVRITPPRPSISEKRVKIR